jgi:hypothetical protein
MSEPDYPRFLQELLTSCPTAHNGVHPWVFKVARYLHRYHPPEEICSILKQCVADCGRPVETHEIVDAVRNSGACKWEPSGKSASERRAEWLASPTSKRVPEFNPELAIRTAAQVPVELSPGWLKAHSPVPVTCSTGEFLREIFGTDEKALVFNRYKSQGHLWPAAVEIESFSRQHWNDGAWFLCNPVDGQSHWNPRLLKQSRRSEEAVTSFRFAVLECDQKPKEKWFPIWLQILVQLALPIVSITDSAGISAHALVRVACESKQAWDQFKFQTLRPLVLLGADDGALSAVRLTRLPCCYRADRRQELLYLNPAADGTPIFQQK